MEIVDQQKKFMKLKFLEASPGIGMQYFETIFQLLVGKDTVFSLGEEAEARVCSDPDRQQLYGTPLVSVNRNGPEGPLW